jgi:HlyD family secretion protein
MRGQVVRIDIESDRVNEERRIYVRCGGMGDCPLAFHVGEQAEITVTVATLPRARLVKVTSLISVRGNQATAWTVEEGRVQQRTVTLGQRTLDGRVEIVSGVRRRGELIDGSVAGLEVGRKPTIVAAKEKAK